MLLWYLNTFENHQKIDNKQSPNKTLSLNLLYLSAPRQNRQLHQDQSLIAPTEISYDIIQIIYLLNKHHQPVSSWSVGSQCVPPIHHMANHNIFKYFPSTTHARARDPLLLEAPRVCCSAGRQAATSRASFDHWLASPFIILGRRRRRRTTPIGARASKLGGLSFLPRTDRRVF